MLNSYIFRVHFRDFFYLILIGFRTCMRALYVTPKNKKIWVFCTHLTAETETRADIDSELPPTEQQAKQVC